jgi:putative exosortase-associated protein (TIGR04073 family)
MKVVYVVAEALMKTFLLCLVAMGFSSALLADIQDPPSNDYGPTRKFGRGMANFYLAPAEIPVTIATINTREGNAAAAGYGVWRGLGRSASRHVAGLFEILTFPYAIWRDTYYPLLPDDHRYIHAGYSEFPPELGNESKHDYVRDY